MSRKYCAKAVGLSKGFPNRKKQQNMVGWFPHALSRFRPREPRWVLRDLSFEIGHGERVALLGKNGTGKTTLLRLLAGIYTQTSGTLDIPHIPATLFRYWVTLSRELTVTESVLLHGATQGVNRETLLRLMPSVLEAAGIQDLRDEPARALSAGQAQSLALAVFIHTPRDFFIFDESFVHLDSWATQRSFALFQEVLRPGKAMVMASHDPQILRRFCNRALWIEEGYLVADGPLETVLSQYDASPASGN